MSAEKKMVKYSRFTGLGPMIRDGPNRWRFGPPCEGQQKPAGAEAAIQIEMFLDPPHNPLFTDAEIDAVIAEVKKEVKV